MSNIEKSSLLVLALLALPVPNDWQKRASMSLFLSEEQSLGIQPSVANVFQIGAKLLEHFMELTIING